jgi:hypothetical protein
MRQAATKSREASLDPKQLRYVDDFVMALTRLKTLFAQGDIDPATYAREMRQSREAIVEVENKDEVRWSTRDRIMHALLISPMPYFD